MVEKVIEYLDGKQWVYTKKDSILTFALSGLNGVYHCVIRVREEVSFISFITYLGTNCPANKRPELAQLLTHINSNLLYGNFEMNLFDGEVKFRTGLYYEGVELNNTLIDNLIMKNIYAMDVSSYQFSKFMFGNVTIPEVYDALYPSTALIEEKKEAILIEDNPPTEPIP
jgi:hypothetical protein